MIDNKGSIPIELIIFIVVALFLGVTGTKTVAEIDKNLEEINKNIELADNLMENYIVSVEEERYVSPSIKARINEDLGNLFSEVNIDGTLEPVNEGEPVYIILTVVVKNLRGGNIAKETFVKRGSSKVRI